MEASDDAKYISLMALKDYIKMQVKTLVGVSIKWKVLVKTFPIVGNSLGWRL
jgi:hypothetical protein